MAVIRSPPPGRERHEEPEGEGGGAPQTSVAPVPHPPPTLPEAGNNLTHTIYGNDMDVTTLADREEEDDHAAGNNDEAEDSPFLRTDMSLTRLGSLPSISDIDDAIVTHALARTDNDLPPSYSEAEMPPPNYDEVVRNNSFGSSGRPVRFADLLVTNSDNSNGSRQNRERPPQLSLAEHMERANRVAQQVMGMRPQVRMTEDESAIRSRLTQMLNSGNAMLNRPVVPHSTTSSGFVPRMNPYAGYREQAQTSILSAVNAASSGASSSTPVTASGLLRAAGSQRPPHIQSSSTQVYVSVAAPVTVAAAAPLSAGYSHSQTSTGPPPVFVYPDPVMSAVPQPVIRRTVSPERHPRQAQFQPIRDPVQEEDSAEEDEREIAEMLRRGQYDRARRRMHENIRENLRERERGVPVRDLTRRQSRHEEERENLPDQNILYAAYSRPQVLNPQAVRPPQYSPPIRRDVRYAAAIQQDHQPRAAPQNVYQPQVAPQYIYQQQAAPQPYVPAAQYVPQNQPQAGYAAAANPPIVQQNGHAGYAWERRPQQQVAPVPADRPWMPPQPPMPNAAPVYGGYPYAAQPVPPHGNVLQFHPMFRSISHALSQFDGAETSAVESWIVHFRNMTYGLSEPEKFFLLSEKLTSRAATWFRDQQQACPLPRDAPIELWLDRLHSHFAQSHSMRKTGLALRRQKKEESPQTFCTDLKHLLMTYNPHMSENEQVDWLRRQIHPDYAAAFAIFCRASDNWTQAVEALAQAMDYTQHHGALSTQPKAAQSFAQEVKVAPAEKADSKFGKMIKELDEKVRSLSLYCERGRLVKSTDENKFRDRVRDRDGHRSLDRRNSHPPSSDRSH
jgi:hypothetical protein